MPVNKRSLPHCLWVVRHGESAGNLAWAAAEASGHHTIDITCRDVDIPLSPLGEQQARALGRWFAHLLPEQQPTVVLTSPYVRARESAGHILDAANIAPRQVAFVIDERLREKEFGILDGLTKIGIRERYPDQHEERLRFGKFYHRPPGGESWCDVILRLRNLLNTMKQEYADERILIVAHQVVVLCFRYILEHMTEEEILAIDRAQEIANCAVTLYNSDPARGELALQLFNFVAPLEATGTPVTSRPDVLPPKQSE